MKIEQAYKQNTDQKSGSLIVEVQDLGVRLSNEFAVVVETLTLTAGQVIVIDAESGAGKSTVLGLVSGAIARSNFGETHHRLFGGDILVNQDRTTFGTPDKIGFVLQTNVLVPYLSVLENIKLPLVIADMKVERDWLASLINTLGLGGLEERMPMEISVGQRQRVAIARAFLGKPALLLLDEPVASLDPANVEQVETLIQSLAIDVEASVILASHQAARGAFAKEARMKHRIFKDSDVTYSVFSMADNDNWVHNS